MADINPAEIAAHLQALIDRNPTGNEKSQAYFIRTALWENGAYPRDASPLGDPGFDQYEARCREIVRQAADKLDRLDIIAVSKLVEIFLLDPKSTDVFGQFQPLLEAWDAARLQWQEDLQAEEAVL